MRTSSLGPEKKSEGLRERGKDEEEDEGNTSSKCDWKSEFRLKTIMDKIMISPQVQVGFRIHI